jgi:hypothetical protein
VTRARLAAAAVALALLGAPPAHAASPLENLFRSRRPAAAPPAPQTRDFETPDLLRAQRLAIAALQDLGFALESADAEHGVLTASLLDTHALRLTITIAAATESTITASVSSDYAGNALSDPLPAESFFTAFAQQLSPPPAID